MLLAAPLCDLITFNSPAVPEWPNNYMLDTSVLERTVHGTCGLEDAPLTRTRVAHRAKMLILAAGGAMSVPSDHSRTPAPSTFWPPIMVEMKPAGTCVIAYPQKKADETKPRSVADQPSSCAIGMTATDMFTCGAARHTHVLQVSKAEPRTEMYRK